MDEPPSQFITDLLAAGSNWFYIFGFSSIIILLAASAFISASEVAFFSLKADFLDKCRTSDDSSEKNIVDLLKKPRLLLATILICHDFVNVAVVTISTFLMWEMTQTRKPAEAIVGIVTFAVTFALTFFSEIIPKVYATQHNLTIAKRVGATWKVLQNFWRPVSWLLLSLSQIVERRVEKKGYSTTVEELNQALELTTKNNETTEEEKDILKGIVNFGTLTVKQVMKSRMDISAVDVELNFTEMMEQVNKSGFSRIPVYRETIDSIEGILYTKDLLPFLDEQENFKWQKLLRPSFFVPETKKLDSLLKDFQGKRVHMAIVVDEYGGTAGIITLEDLIEEIIGDINDEFDEVSTAYQKIDDHTFIFEGKISIHDLCKALGVDSTMFEDVKGESESLGGLILELHSALPKVGDQIVFDRFTFTILNVDKKRIARVRVAVQEETLKHEE
ncbi:MAG TPA: gliding motility-associated protein GldE [Cytophagales bacterium]|jgi:putative hemolysin|nr:gliding motility-associated protein GldE [Cytophagales bacterium]